MGVVTRVKDPHTYRQRCLLHLVIPDQLRDPDQELVDRAQPVQEVEDRGDRQT